MQIEYIEIEKVIPFDKNPRKNDEAIEYVKNSIAAFGFKVPLVVDKNNVIVCGHSRYRAAKELNIAQLPCIKADDLTEEQIAAFRVADNKVTEFSKWDYDLLNVELDLLNDVFDMSDFGFYEMDESYIDDFFDEADKREEKKEQKEEEKEDVKEENKQQFVVVTFDEEQELEEFISYCEEKGYDYERGVKP